MCMHAFIDIGGAEKSCTTCAALTQENENLKSAIAAMNSKKKCYKWYLVLMVNGDIDLLKICVWCFLKMCILYFSHTEIFSS